MKKYLERSAHVLIDKESGNTNGERSKTLQNWRPLRFLRFYGIPLIALLISINQLRLRQDGISSWKGGGFGMYAEMHPVYTKVFVKTHDGVVSRPSSGQSFETVNEVLANTQMYPSQRRLDRLKDEYASLYGNSSYTVEIWAPEFDPDSATFSLHLEKAY